MSLIEADKTKVLGLTVGSRENVQPGQFVPRSGKIDRTKHSNQD
jgi:hypothetical protein